MNKNKRLIYIICFVGALIGILLLFSGSLAELFAKGRICPDEWVNNQTPSDYNESRQYFMVNGVSLEGDVNLLDALWSTVVCMKILRKVS